MPINRKKYPSNWKEISNHIRQIRGNKCEKCDTPGKRNNVLTVHHFDYNPQNNSADNLLLLCQKCHLWLQQKYPSVRSMEDYHYLTTVEKSQLQLQGV